jgi:hypothetical protein
MPYTRAKILYGKFTINVNSKLQGNTTGEQGNREIREQGTD